jgi:hypothetical protein
MALPQETALDVIKFDPRRAAAGEQDQRGHK